jgi:hypothetical protein
MSDPGDVDVAAEAGLRCEGCHHLLPGPGVAVELGGPVTAVPTVVVDHFHVVQLANKMLNVVRRRTTATLRGRRGRACDPEWKARRRILRNHEDLTDGRIMNAGKSLKTSSTVTHCGI